MACRPGSRAYITVWKIEKFYGIIFLIKIKANPKTIKHFKNKVILQKIITFIT